MLIDTPGNVAVPLTAATVAVPDRVPALGLVPIAIVTLAVLGVRFPYWSWIWTVGEGLIEVPATVLVGCTVRASLLAAAGVLVSAKLAEVAPVVVAVMETGPAVVLAVKVLLVARPSLPVVAVIVLVAGPVLLAKPGSTVERLVIMIRS